MPFQLNVARLQQVERIEAASYLKTRDEAARAAFSARPGGAALSLVVACGGVCRKRQSRL